MKLPSVRMNYRPVRRIGRDRFEVRFERLKRELLPLRKQILMDRSMLQVDPQLILEAIRRVMPYCELHDGAGNRLVWNEFKVFLAREDHDEFAPMEPRLVAEADQVLDAYRKSLGAEAIGDLTLRLLVDDSDAVEGRVSVIQVAAKANKALNEYVAPPEEITVRLPAAGAGSDKGASSPVPGYPSLERPPFDFPAEPVAVGSDGQTGVHPNGNGVSHGLNGNGHHGYAAEDQPTDRLVEDVHGLTLRWDGGSASVGPGVRWTVGRQADTPPADYCIALSNASTRISTRAFWIEGKVDADGEIDGATIGRFDHDTANAVHINGELLGRGQEIRIFDFPTAIELTGGEFRLSLER
ncbi:hypothetical protein ABI59_17110 [Acidobacteria bacterium Mor1]|nr:hypothetical protein ABI59_17110 [Acidobacteria bacterium Mor1]